MVLAAVRLLLGLVAHSCRHGGLLAATIRLGYPMPQSWADASMSASSRGQTVCVGSTPSTRLSPTRHASKPSSSPTRGTDRHFYVRSFVRFRALSARHTPTSPEKGVRGRRSHRHKGGTFTCVNGLLINLDHFAPSRKFGGARKSAPLASVQGGCGMPIPSRVYALWRQTQHSVTRKPMSNNPLSTSYFCGKY